MKSYLHEHRHITLVMYEFHSCRHSLAEGAINENLGLETAKSQKDLTL